MPRRGRAAPVEIVREPPRARAEHEHALRRRVPDQPVHDRGGDLVLLVAPCPVAMNVRVIGREALIGRQARAQRKLRGVSRGVPVELEGREQRPQTLVVILRSCREVRETRLCGRPQIVARERRAQLLHVAERALQRQAQAPAPLVERRRGLREQPWHARHVRKFASATGAAQHVARALERAVAARAGEEIQKLGRAVHLKAT